MQCDAEYHWGQFGPYDQFRFTAQLTDPLHVMSQ